MDIKFCERPKFLAWSPLSSGPSRQFHQMSAGPDGEVMDAVYSIRFRSISMASTPSRSFSGG